MELPALKVGKPRPTPVVRGGITYNRVEIDIGWENGFPECDILNQIIKDIEKQRGES